VDYGNGSKPVALRVYNVFENGDALCGGEIPVGAYLSLGQVDHDGIIGTAEAALAQISGVEGANGFLMYPCVSRYMMLSPDKDEEIRKVIGTVGESQPYVITYSGGEICPVYGEDGKTYNRFHNYTCVACVF
ncbi:MAG: FIST C-terminal domain-containing protein, partial [Oscillospiraceae bacterium]|nr:FIST C-terminal domain-containing protein [Oscillospiraceae bacterium]